MHSVKLFKLFVVALLAIALHTAEVARAVVVTQVVELATPLGSQGQLTVQGTIDTLAQGLREVDGGSTTVGVSGLLRAQLTLEVLDEGSIELLGFELLESSFTQDGVNLFYDVPGTSRRITFSATGLQFSLQHNGQSPPNSGSQLLTTGPIIPTNSYQMVQNTGMAEVGITNRPSKQQNLAQQSVLSTYDSNQPVGQTSFAIVPPGQGSEQSFIELSLPLSHQQMHYAGVGLPVTLNYSGILNLIGALPVINNQVPEPGTLALLGTVVLLLSRRNSRIAFRGL